MAEEKEKQKSVGGSPFKELGSTGRSPWGSLVAYTESEAKLRGLAGVNFYDKMRRTDHTAAAEHAVLTLPIRKVEWRAEAGGLAEADKTGAVYLWDALGDMSLSFQDVIADVCTMFPFGWAWHEMVLKRRADGRVGFKKIALRPQRTLIDWIYEDDGDIKAMLQMTGQGAPVEVPLTRSLLFRTTREGDEPEGLSIYRPGVRPYEYRLRLEQVEGIGLYRRWAGFPQVNLPPGASTIADLGDDSDEYKAEQLVKSIYLDRMMGAYLPDGWTLNLGGPEGGRIDSTLGETIIRKDAEMARAILAQFLLMGLKEVGTQALAVTLLESFLMSLEAYLEIIAGIFNRYMVPYLFRWVIIPGMTALPVLKYSSVRKVDLTSLAAFLTAIAKTGGLTIDSRTEDFFRSLVPGMPEAPTRPAGDGVTTTAPDAGTVDKQQTDGEGTQAAPDETDDEPSPNETPPEDGEDFTWLAFPKVSWGRADFQQWGEKPAPGERLGAYNALADENAAAQRANLENWADDVAARVGDLDVDVTASELAAKLDDWLLVGLLMFRERSVLDIGAAFWLGFGAPTGPPEALIGLQNEIYLADQWIGYGSDGQIRATNPAGRPSLFGDIRGTLEGRIAAILLLLKGGRREEAMLEVRQAVHAATQGFSRGELYAGHVWHATWVGAHYGSPEILEKMRWVLDAWAKHCEDCPEFGDDPPGREYPSWDAMVAFTGGVLPGYGTECRGRCRCHLKALRNGEWVVI